MKDMFSPKGEKLTEKAFSHSLLVSVISILMCVVALCSITYAWFTTNVSSGENVIESSRFSLDISVFNANGDLNVTENPDGTYSCTFEAAGTYTVILQLTDDTTATKGYCEFIINSTEKKQTESISRDATFGVEKFTVTVEIASDNTVIVFSPKWGISASADIADGDTLTVPGAATSDVDSAQ